MTILRKVRDIAGVTWNGYDKYEIKQRLCLTWTSLDENMVKIVERREKYLQELASATNCNDQEKALQQNWTREASNCQF